ncbi:MAG TPA: hypothetical protein DCZ41_01875 [Firmicutes bacterium]|nr:hypothetical protein [Bacillota bacterium]
MRRQNEDSSVFCTNCGASLEETKDSFQTSSSKAGVSTKSRGLATILCALFYCTGVAGIHRFYAGKIGTGVLWLLTFGLFGIGQLVDIIMILCGSFEDIDGNVLSNWNID